MKLKLLALLIWLPVLGSAQGLKIKNGTSHTLKEVKMNGGSDVIDNLLEDYHNNQPLNQGETLNLPKCTRFGTGSSIVFSIVAKDTEQGLYMLEQVDLCKAKEVVFTNDHLIAEEASDLDLDQYIDLDALDPEALKVANEAAYERFTNFIENHFLPAFKTGVYAKVKPFLASEILDASNVSIAGSAGFNQRELSKALSWLRQNGSPELTPNPALDLAMPLLPTIFIGLNEQEGYYFIFRSDDGETFVVSQILDPEVYGMMVDQLMAENTQPGEDSEMIYFITETSDPFLGLVKARDLVKLRSLCAHKDLADGLVDNLDFMNENIERAGIYRSGEVFEVNGKMVEAHFMVSFETKINADGEAAAVQFYFAPSDDGGYKIIYMLAAG